MLVDERVFVSLCCRATCDIGRGSPLCSAPALDHDGGELVYMDPPIMKVFDICKF